MPIQISNAGRTPVADASVTAQPLVPNGAASQAAFQAAMAQAGTDQPASEEDAFKAAQHFVMYSTIRDAMMRIMDQQEQTRRDCADDD